MQYNVSREQKKSPQVKKPSFDDACAYHDDISTGLLILIAEVVGVSHTVVTAMRAGEPVERQDAVKLLEQFSQLVGRQYNLSNLDIPLKDGEEEEA